MEINPEDRIIVDYTKYSIAAQKIRPEVYKDGDSFCCLSGPDPENGVFGCGSTPDAAISDWYSSLVDKLNANKRDDETARKVRDELGIGEKPIDPDVQAFYDQFKPYKRRE